MVVDGIQLRHQHNMGQLQRLGQAELGRETRGVDITRVRRHLQRDMAPGRQGCGLMMRRLDMQSLQRHR